MARKAIAKDQIVKLIVGAGQASPSPPVGPALGSKGVKSMDFCKVCIAHSKSPPIDRKTRPRLTNLSFLGVQCKDSALRSRHTYPCAHHRPTRSLISLSASHPTHCNSASQRGWCATDQEQSTWRRKCPWPNEQPRRTERKDINK